MSETVLNVLCNSLQPLPVQQRLDPTVRSELILFYDGICYVLFFFQGNYESNLLNFLETYFVHF